MAHGTVPVVTAASSGIDGVIQHQENGLVVPIGDMAGMANVIAQLAADRSLLSKIGRAAHDTSQAYGMEKYSEEFTKILDQVLEAGKRVDFYERYGIFGYSHPLYKQQQLLAEQQEQISQLQQGAIQRFVDRSQRMIPPKMRGLLRIRRA
jgi:hypothetical protein